MKIAKDGVKLTGFSSMILREVNLIVLAHHSHFNRRRTKVEADDRYRLRESSG